MEVENTTSAIDPLNIYYNLNNFLLNPLVLIILVLIIIAYFVLFSSLGNNQISTSENNSGQNIFLIIILVILVILILINAAHYFYNINIIDVIKRFFKSLFKPNQELDDIILDKNIDNNIDKSSFKPSQTSHLKFNKQVFNVPGNHYNYEDATALCKAYGGKLATYQQIEDSYKNGGEWCNYGWSDKQMALFPTQQNTYDGLQKIAGHEHDCGRPGINGGYIANPNVKFGVNCFGYKPKITQEEEELMKITTPYPQTKEELEFQNKVDFWKNKINSVLLSPFNYNSWEEV